MQLNTYLRIFFVLGWIFTSHALFAQRHQPVKDTISGDAFIRMLEQSLSMYYSELASNGNTDSIVDALAYEASTVPFFSDEVYCQRLSKMNERSDFGFDCNPVSLTTIKFFAENRRNFAKVALGRSKLYFDLFEEKLAEYNLPLELKYLSVIESGLRPQVKSRAGALGLWQFMYATGKQYGLTENSYLDERMDPVKATDAACRYLKKLYDIYDDWNLALAAYNAGPGNVNHAIRRSGGKRTYWEIRPFLPRETQGYVPNFIAAAYLLTYHAEHNILPAESQLHYYQLDTMCLNGGIHMQTIDKLVGWATEDIQSLNPVYKTTFIPPTNPQQCITGPLEKIGLLVSLEDSLYAVERRFYGSGGSYTPPAANPNENQMVVSNPNPVKQVPKTQVVTTVKYTYHRVKNGESLGKIAAQYNASIQDVMEWNQLSSTRISVGQMLRIQTQITTTIENPEYLQQQQQAPADSLGQAEPEPVVQQVTKPQAKPEVRKKYYSVRSGDTFSTIASRHGLTVTQLRRLNPGVNVSRIAPGQRLRIK